jgi:hypothetical protein
VSQIASQDEPTTAPNRRGANNRGRSFGVPIYGYQGKLERIAARKARVEAMARELAEGLGGDLDRMSGLNREYLLKAADLLTRKARTAEDAVRMLNTARGLIASVERRIGRVEAPDATAAFATMLGDGE